jgi:hypothetical protein
MLMNPGVTASPPHHPRAAGEIPDGRDRIATDRNVGDASGRAGAVVDGAAADDQVVVRTGSAGEE